MDISALSTERRAALARLNAFSKPAFGLSLYFLSSPDETAWCCSRGRGNRAGTDECRDFQRALFSREGHQCSACPAGLVVLSRAVTLEDSSRGLLVTDGFIEEERGSSPSSAAAQEGEGGEVPRQSPRQSGLLDRFLDVAVFSLGSSKTNRVETAVLSAREDFWKSKSGDLSLAGVSQGIEKIRRTLATYANSGEPLLIESEQGNGRRLTAAIIHRLGPRCDRPFVCETISVLPDGFQETELFGPEGYGNGGLVEHAAGGTLFLEDIEQLSASAQRRLMNFLPESSGARFASTEGARANVRIIATSSKNLETLARKGRFLADLHRRLRHFTVFIPPLRERREDVPVLIDHFLRHDVGGNGKGSRTVERESLSLLQKYSWPGNARELKNELLSATLNGSQEIGLEDFSPHIQNAARPPQASLSNIKEAVGNLETTMISRTLSETNWNKSQAARILGLSRLGLQKKIDRYELDRRR
jgi:DNA-binding NtrC family response regulator